MSSASPDCDILIVGAGPVGLFLAHECARRSLILQATGRLRVCAMAEDIARPIR